MRIIFLLIISILITSCSVFKLLKASETRDYGFLPNPKLFKADFDSTPFHRRWILSDIEKYNKIKTDHKEIYIERVNLNILEKEYSKIKDKFNREAKVEEAGQLGQYFYYKLKLAIEATASDYKVVEKPSKKSVRVALALVELEPTNPYINIAGTTVGFFVPGGGLIKTFAKGGVAIEGYIDEVNFKLLLEQFKDKESDKSAPFSVKDFQKYAHIRSAVDDWSMQLAEILTKPVGAEVSDSLPFELAVY